MELKEQLSEEKRNFLIKANGGLSLPVAGALYWFALGIVGLYVQPNTWFLIACFSSGLIFPLGLLLSKPLKSDLNVSSPLTSLFGPALISMMMFWPLAIAGASTNVSFITLAIAIGMGIHWPVVGWMYGRIIFMLHGITRAIGCTMLWYVFPDQRFVLIPFFVSLVYLITIVGIKREVKLAIQEKIAVKV
jgi:hypothetical protein